MPLPVFWYNGEKDLTVRSMSRLTYRKMLSENDMDIPKIKAVYQTPEVSQYISIGDNYFCYVTNTENVYYFKVYENERLIGTVHLEKQGSVLSVAILVFYEYQRQGFGTRIVKDIQNGVFGIEYDNIEISIDERNAASLKLFENAGFIRVSQDGELINMVFHLKNSLYNISLAR